MARLNEFSHPARAPKGQRKDKHNDAVRAAAAEGLSAYGSIDSAKDRRAVRRAQTRRDEAVEVCRQLAELCKPIDVGFDVVAQGMSVTVPASLIAAARKAIGGAA